VVTVAFTLAETTPYVGQPGGADAAVTTCTTRDPPSPSSTRSTSRPSSPSNSDVSFVVKPAALFPINSD
jgi:hypothetical protein